MSTLLGHEMIEKNLERHKCISWKYEELEIILAQIMKTSVKSTPSFSLC